MAPWIRRVQSSLPQLWLGGEKTHFTGEISASEETGGQDASNLLS